MLNKHKKWVPIILALIIALAAVLFIAYHNIAVFNPKGVIASKERRLMFIAIILGVIVVVPTYAMTIFIAYKYRENNGKSKKYSPDYDHSNKLEITWWAIPTIIIGILAYVTWVSSHRLDPYKAIASTNRPLNIQVIALDWKWLFIYPDQNIASVNFFQIPVNRPVKFHITSDTVMNSFWVPQLGGQIYAMPGMDTQLNLMASSAGNYYGSSANISGNGFAGMTFTAKASSAGSFKDWIKHAAQAGRPLSFDTYNQLAKPSKYNPVSYFSSVASGLYDYTVDKYMLPASQLPKPGSGQPLVIPYNQQRNGMEMSQ